MARFCIAMVLGGALLFHLSISVGKSDQSSNSPPANESQPSGYLLPQRPDTRLSRPEQRGKILYEYYCALCHGKAGNADGFNSYSLTTPPAKHADATRMAALSDTQIEAIIGEGGPVLERSPQMPPWGGVLTDQEIFYLTVYIRRLSKQEGGGE